MEKKLWPNRSHFKLMYWHLHTSLSWYVTRVKFTVLRPSPSEPGFSDNINRFMIFVLNASQQHSSLGLLRIFPWSQITGHLEGIANDKLIKCLFLKNPTWLWVCWCIEENCLIHVIKAYLYNMTAKIKLYHTQFQTQSIGKCVHIFPTPHVHSMTA